ncbi:hypothetical protein BCU68_09145 [Vibrio sp. 10N.286.49.B3]|uniref:O-antigen ligase family protein n=1 Tax=Vibrio sp. 10N.286.49.B3 TaxID=1880855 RepID=UPI000C82183C|nr:O-antigen ligase family protein [Vibrio sp. 10N.286.49.B3]PMH45950.1 hypothetical protein BCU68_09145 [Vibrio sp. 10N.286.49.B3]
MLAKDFGRLCIGFLLFLSIVFPVVFQPLKMFILMAILLVTVILSYRGLLLINKNVLMFSFFYSLIGIAWSVYGEVEGNPGASRVITVMFFYPIIFGLLTVYYKDNLLHSLHKLIKLGGLSILLIQIAFILSSLGIDGGGVSEFIKGLYGHLAVVNSGDGFLLFTLPNVSSLLFIIPYFLVYILYNKNTSFSDLFLLLGLVALILLTGRRAFFLATFLTLILIIPIGYLAGFSQFKVLMSITVISVTFIASFLLAVMLNVINTDMLYESILSIVQFNSDPSNNERLLQLYALYDGFSESPLIGAGAGAVASYIRSYEHPWAYELYYASLLFQYGLIGFIFYLVGVIYLIASMIKKIFYSQYDVYYISILSGMVSFLIATFTNPYLAKFDYMWVIFLPASIVLSKNKV